MTLPWLLVTVLCIGWVIPFPTCLNRGISTNGLLTISTYLSANMSTYINLCQHIFHACYYPPAMRRRLDYFIQNRQSSERFAHSWSWVIVLNLHNLQMLWHKKMQPIQTRMRFQVHSQMNPLNILDHYFCNSFHDVLIHIHYYITIYLKLLFECNFQHFFTKMAVVKFVGGGNDSDQPIHTATGTI